MTKKEAIHFLYQIADEIQSFLDKTSSPKGQWTSHKRLEALSMAISALYDLFQAEEDGRLIIPPCKVGDTVWVITGTAIKHCDGCTLSALCECMPAALPKLINAIAENKEKSGGKK